MHAQIGYPHMQLPLAWQFLFVWMAVVFWKTLFLHCEVNITSCTFHTEQHPHYGVHTVLSGMRKLILAVPTVKFTLVQISCEHLSCVCLWMHTCYSIFHAECWHWKHIYTYSEWLRQPMHMLHTNQLLPWWVDVTLHFSQTLGSINMGFVPTMTTMLTIQRMIQVLVMATN